MERLDRILNETVFDVDTVQLIYSYSNLPVHTLIEETCRVHLRISRTETLKRAVSSAARKRQITSDEEELFTYLCEFPVGSGKVHPWDRVIIAAARFGCMRVIHNIEDFSDMNSGIPLNAFFHCIRSNTTTLTRYFRERYRLYQKSAFRCFIASLHAGNTEIAQLFLKDFVVDSNSVTSHMNSVISKGHLESVKYMVARGCDVTSVHLFKAISEFQHEIAVYFINSRTFSYAVLVTALEKSVLLSQYELMRLLQTKVTLTEEETDELFVIAVEHSDFAIIEYFIKNKVIVTLNHLEVVCAGGDAKKIDLVFNSLDLGRHNYESALRIAIRYSNVNLAGILLGWMAKCDFDYYKSVRYAIICQSNSVFTLFYERKLLKDFNVKNLVKDAFRSGNLYVLQLLHESGSDLKAFITPFDIGQNVFNNNLHVVDYFHSVNTPEGEREEHIVYGDYPAAKTCIGTQTGENAYSVEEVYVLNSHSNLCARKVRGKKQVREEAASFSVEGNVSIHAGLDRCFGMTGCEERIFRTCVDPEAAKNADMVDDFL